ncbi:MAG: nuclear transport factor 2 family protein [Pseudomonadota bacterium]
MSQVVADRIAIQDVMLRYAAGVDDRDMDLYRSCFAGDVEVVGFADANIQGADAWAKHVVTALERFGPTQHMLSPVYAEVDGDEAKARTDVQAMHYLKEPEGHTLTLWATYHSNMRRIDGEWKIVRHELVSRGTKIGAS